MKKHGLLGLSLICFLLFLCTQASADFISNFNTDAEGWKIYGEYFPEPGTDPTYNGSGGNPGGYISANEDGYWYFWQSAWVDWSGYYGGTIEFDIIVNANEPQYTTGEKVIIDLPGPEPDFDAPGYYAYCEVKMDPPLGEWTHYEIRILDINFTVLQAGEVSPYPLSSFLSEANGLLIRGDLIQGDATTGLDNVRVSAFSESDELAVDFDGNGLWHYDGSSWTNLAGWDSEGMEAWGSGLAVDFGTYGLWNYDGSTWTSLAGWNPGGMEAYGNGLAVDFDTYGLWYYDGSTWTSLAGWNPEDMEAWGTGLAVDFGSYGLWNYDGLSWTSLAGWDSEDMIDVDLY